MEKVEHNEKEVRITLRLPSRLHAELVEEAEKNSRSMNGEIVNQLEIMSDISRKLEEREKELLQLKKDFHILTELIARYEDGDLSPDRVLYVALDANGFPTSWTEITTHLARIARAGGVNAQQIEARVFNAEMASSDEREAEWLKIHRHYQKLMRRKQV